MSSQAPPEGPAVRTLEYENFEPGAAAAPRGPRAFEPQEFTPLQSKGSPAGPLGPAERMGFIPLLDIDEQTDPREAAEREARRMKAEADRMVTEARGQVETLQTRARDEGYQAGYEQGMTEGREASAAMMTAAVENLSRAVEALDQARTRVMGRLEQEVVALVAASTDLVLMTPGAVRPELVRNVVRGAIERVSQAERLSVRLNPEDLELVQEFRPELAKGLGRLQQLDLAADASLGRGDCLVEAPQGQVDATLDTRRRQLWQILEETLHQDEGLDLEPLTSTPVAQDSAPEPEDGPAEREQAAMEEEIDW